MRQQSNYCKFFLTGISWLLLGTGLAGANEMPAIKTGVLQFGTVNWELATMVEHKLDEAAGFTMETVPLGNKNATAVALQGGEVDVIVSDWIWVSRQRSAGKNYVFFPYSNAVGGMVVSPESGITGLQDLRGKRLGIAGGPVDKSWLIYRAYIKKLHGFDLADVVDAKFAAPPLLNKLMEKGDLDAVITFWKFGAKLIASGMKPMPSIPEILPALGINTAMPLLGWVFDENWAGENPRLVDGLLAASYASKKLLITSDEQWQKLSPRIKPTSEQELRSLRDTYRAGVPAQFTETEIRGAEEIYQLLAKEGGRKLVGDSAHLAEGTFWTEFQIEN